MNKTSSELSKQYNTLTFLTDIMTILLKSSKNSSADSSKLASLINTLLKNTIAFIN